MSNLTRKLQRPQHKGQPLYFPQLRRSWKKGQWGAKLRFLYTTFALDNPEIVREIYLHHTKGFRIARIKRGV